tara:strand:- start:2293 stop:2613 length:321 start_codon:yes stop_codon:yes gene_type:complete
MNPIIAKLTAHQAELFISELNGNDMATLNCWENNDQDNLLALVTCLHSHDHIITSELIETATEEARMIVDIHANNIADGWAYGEELAELRKIISTMKRILKTLDVA